MRKGIYLDVDEELTSAIEKIKATPEPRVFLVVPKRAGISQSIVNFKILAHQAKKMEKELVVVTTDQTGRNLARRAGLLVQQEVGGPVEEVNLPRPAVIRKAASRAEAGSRQRPLSANEAGPEGLVTSREKYREKFNWKNLLQKVRSKDKASSETPAMKKLPKPKSRLLGKPKKGGKITLLPHMSGRLIALIIGVAVVFITVVIFLVLPRTIVTIQPKIEPASQGLEVLVYSDLDEVDIASQAVPGEIISVEEAETKNFKATGSQAVGTKAGGPATLYNNYSSDPQPLVKDTRLQDVSGRVFRLAASVTIPGAKVSAGATIPGEVSANIVADQIGPEYNIEPGRLSIPGLPAAKQSQIYGQTTQKLTGGESRDVTVVSAENIENAEKELTEQLEQKARQDLAGKTPADMKFLPEAIETAVTRKEPNKAAGTESEDFDLTVAMEVKSIIFSENDVREVAVNEIEAAITDDKYLLGEAETGLTFELASIDLAANKAVLAIKADKKAAFRLDEEVIQENIAGKSKSGAEDYLNTLENVSRAEVKLWPFWVKKAPRDPGKVKINIDTDTSL